MDYRISRREFMKVLLAGGAAALTGCGQGQPEKLIPYLIAPDEVVPGIATWYMTVCRECPAGCGMHVRTREGRAVKVEGNPNHPINKGRLCALGQASLQGLYNPDRIQSPLKRDDKGNLNPIDWAGAESLLAQKLMDLRNKERFGAVTFLTNLENGSFARFIDDWMAVYRLGRRMVYEPFAYEPIRAANRLAFGQDEIPEYRIEEADFLLSLGADLLETWLSPVAFSGAFKEMRSPHDGKMGTYVHMEPRFSRTAANADQWISIRPGTEGLLVLGMINEILNQALNVPLPIEELEGIKGMVRDHDPEAVSSRTDLPAERIRGLAHAFAEAERALAVGGGVAVSGRNATDVQVAVNLLNYVTGNVGRTVRFGRGASIGRTNTFSDMLALRDAMNNGEVDILILYNVNPLFTIPPSSGFREAMEKVPLLVSFSSFMDETTAKAHLILPAHTPLESWGDYSPRDGIYGLMQPVMQPVFQSKSPGDVILSVTKQFGEEEAKAFPWVDFYSYLRNEWKSIQLKHEPDAEFEAFWIGALQRGGYWPGAEEEPVSLSGEVFDHDIKEAEFDGEGDGSLYLMAYPSSSHFDGRGANKPWLQELPDTMTTIVWDSWVEVHPETARRRNIREGDLVSISSPHGTVRASVHLYEEVRPDVVAIPIGQGHTDYGRYAGGVGASPVNLLGGEAEEPSGGLPWLSVRVALSPTGKRSPLVITAGSRRQYERGIAKAISFEDLRHTNGGGGEREGGAPMEGHGGKEGEHPSMYGKHEHKEYLWGMAIDINACSGCGACVVACYAENNLAVVGKKWAAQGHEMAWIHIERYFEGDPGNPEVRFIPMLCQQCENAPCEPVCPVFATYHHPDGLNAQIYNRCVGTRYCSNNCPYKVRRFNWFTYKWPEPLNWQLNPDVSVRDKGVMEKCTFCFQRIREAKDTAKDLGRPVQDGEAVPACAQTCPTNAIVFGNLNDPESQVSKIVKDPRGYRVLESLNTSPSITYLKKVIRKPEEI